GGEAHRAGGVERLRLDRVVEPNSRALVVGIGGDERVRTVPEGQDRVVDAVFGQLRQHSLDHRPVDDRQHLLGDRGGERTQSGAEPAHQDDRSHGAGGAAGAESSVGTLFGDAPSGGVLAPVAEESVGTGTSSVDVPVVACGTDGVAPGRSLRLSSVATESGRGTSVPSGTTAKVKAARSRSSTTSPKPEVWISGSACRSSAGHS